LYQQLEQIEGDSSDYDSENESDEENESEEEPEEAENEEDLDDGDLEKRRLRERRKEARHLKEIKKLKRKVRMKFLNYYRGSFYGSSTASVLFELSKQLNKETKNLLWLWILGLSDIVIHCKAGELDYSDELGRCSEEV
jgi:cell division control protein 45